MTAETPAKPSYLGLLNRLAVGESRAGVYLKAWADTTPDPELKRALLLVAARESTHGEVFKQRIDRLGFAVRETEDPSFATMLAMFGDPTLSDREKIKRSSGGDKRQDGDEPAPDAIADLSARTEDGSMDQLTRDTMRWYLAEERDTLELLRDVYQGVLARG